VLYANKNTEPEIVSGYGLKKVNPHHLERIKEDSLEAHISELKTIQKIDPESKRVNHALSRILFANKKYEESLKYARIFQRNYPEETNGHYLAGISNQNLKRYDEALTAYFKALEVSDEKFKVTLYRQIGVTLYLQGNFREAYEYLQKGLNPYVRAENSKDLYIYAFCALSTGEIEHAEKLFKMILHTAKESEHKVINNSTELLAKIEAGELEVPSVWDWLKSLY